MTSAIEELDKLLKEHKICFRRSDGENAMSAQQITWPRTNKINRFRISVMYGPGTYGYRDGFLELLVAKKTDTEIAKHLLKQEPYEKGIFSGGIFVVNVKEAFECIKGFNDNVIKTMN